MGMGQSNKVKENAMGCCSKKLGVAWAMSVAKSSRVVSEAL